MWDKNMLLLRFIKGFKNMFEKLYGFVLPATQVRNFGLKPIWDQLTPPFQGKCSGAQKRIE